MKTIITLAIFLTTLFLTAQTEASMTSEGTTITITIPVQSPEGSILIGLYDETSFLKKPILSLEGEIVDGKSTVTFQDVPPGTYAISLFHDKNGNKQMDFELNGMPKESYGLSNNVMNFGPPQWSDAKFEVTSEPIEMEIRM